MRRWMFKPHLQRARPAAVFAVCALLAISGCERLYHVRQIAERRLTSHFVSHEDAFNALAQKILSDETYLDVTHCPDPKSIVWSKEPDEKRLAQITDYEPFLKALDFPGCVFATKRNNGSIWIPNAGYASHGDFEISYAYTFWPAGPDVQDICEWNITTIESHTCYQPLHGAWYLEEERLNMRLVRIESEAEIACWDANGTEAECDAAALAAGEKYIRRHKQ